MRNVARLIKSVAAKMRQRHPDQEEMICVGVEDGLVKFRRSDWPEGMEHSASTSGRINAIPGSLLRIGYEGGDRNRAFVLGRGLGAGLSVVTPLPDLVFGRWMQAEANPYLLRGPLVNQIPFPWFTNSTSEKLSVPRYYDGSSLIAGRPAGIESLQNVECLVLRDGKVTIFVNLFSEDDGSILAYLCQELDLASELVSNEWLLPLSSPIGSATYTNRGRFGHLFFDNVSDTYTALTREGIYNLRPGESETFLAWEASYGAIPPESCCSVAWAWALQGAHLGYDAISGGASDCAVHAYRRVSAAWTHLAKIQLPDLLSDCDWVRACGKWDPLDNLEPQSALNTRWALSKAQEWAVWIFGRAGEFADCTVAKAKLVGINCNTGAPRTILTLPAPLYKSLPKGESVYKAELEAPLYAASTLSDPTTWIPTSGGEFVGKLKGANWLNPSTGLFEGESPAAFSVPYADRPPDGYLSASYAEIIRPYSGNWVTTSDPTVAPDCQRLACGELPGETEQTDFPRGVSTDDGRQYVFLREAAWLADGVRTDSEEESTYAGFEDFAIGAGAGGSNDAVQRIYKFSAAVNSAGFAYGATYRRCVLHIIGPSGLLEETLDLTREFSVGDDRYHQEPIIWEYLVKGNYVWVLASDWFAYNDQRLTLILLNKTSGIELTRLDLAEGSGRLVSLGFRPQLLVGADGTGPYAEVLADWTGPDEWIRQVIRYNGSALTISDATSASVSFAEKPSMNEAMSLALDSKAYWFRDSQKLVTQNA